MATFLKVASGSKMNINHKKSELLPHFVGATRLRRLGRIWPDIKNTKFSKCSEYSHVGTRLNDNFMQNEILEVKLLNYLIIKSFSLSKTQEIG